MKIAPYIKHVLDNIARGFFFRLGRDFVLVKCYIESVNFQLRMGTFCHSYYRGRITVMN